MYNELEPEDVEILAAPGSRFDKINWLQAGIQSADKLLTVRVCTISHLGGLTRMLLTQAMRLPAEGLSSQMQNDDPHSASCPQVSPTYAKEMMENVSKGCELDGVIE